MATPEVTRIRSRGYFRIYTTMLFEVNKNGRSATSGVGAIAVSASAVKHNAGPDAVFNATLNANIIKVLRTKITFNGANNIGGEDDAR